MYHYSFIRARIEICAEGNFQCKAKRRWIALRVFISTRGNEITRWKLLNQIRLFEGFFSANLSCSDLCLYAYSFATKSSCFYIDFKLFFINISRRT